MRIHAVAGEVAALTGINLGAGFTFVSAVMGATHVCAVLNETATSKTQIKCWGDGALGQLLDAAKAGATTPPAAALAFNVGLNPIGLGGSYSHRCAIMNDNTLRCWGDNAKGQLGLGSTAIWGDGNGEASQTVTTQIGAGRTVTTIGGGIEHTCALLDNGSLKCWGSGLNGQTGLEIATTDNRGDLGNEMNDLLPVVNYGTGNIVQLAVGHRHNCILLNTNDIRCWGINTTGTLGRGDVTTIGDTVGEMGAALQNLIMTGN
jgi:alpha-tubulin suppressor-like RCC1 family protein